MVGADVFEKFATLAARCVDELDGPREVVAYTLLMFFRSAAYDVGDRPIFSSESSAFQSAFHQPVLKAIEYLQNNEPDPNQLEAICLPVIKAHRSIMPF